MSEFYGPFLTLEITILTILPAIPAAVFWSIGYGTRAILNGENFKYPDWLCIHDVTVNYKRAKPYQVYLWKGIAWAINLGWILSLLSEPGCGRWVEQECTPIYSNAAFHNIALLDVGGIVFELVLFFALIGYFRWRVIQVREP